MSVILRKADLSSAEINEISLNCKFCVFGSKEIHIPFSYAIQKGFREKICPVDTPEAIFSFHGTLRPVQEDLARDALLQLDTRYSCLISMATGMGKTITSLYLMTKLQRKTVVVINREVLWEQWISSLQTFTDAKVCKVKTNKIDFTCDVFLTTPHYLSSRREELVGKFGLMIVDEAHSVTTPKAVRGILGHHPQYLIGLTATPDNRERDLEVIEELYSPSSLFLTRTISKSNIDYREIHTGISIPTYIWSQTMWWNVLNAQAYNVSRNIMIANLCTAHPDRNIIIFGKRIDQLEQIASYLEDYQILTANKKLDLSKRILLTTFSKSGVGMDRPNTDMLIFASDVREMFGQYVGRCLRRPDVQPIIYDIVDRNTSILSHTMVRREYILSIGGKITTPPPMHLDSIILVVPETIQYLDTRPVVMENVCTALQCGINNITIVTTRENAMILAKFPITQDMYCYCSSGEDSYQCKNCVDICSCNYHQSEKCMNRNGRVLCKCTRTVCSCVRLNLRFQIEEVDIPSSRVLWGDGNTRYTTTHLIAVMQIPKSGTLKDKNIELSILEPECIGQDPLDIYTLD